MSASLVALERATYLTVKIADQQTPKNTQIPL
nr:MAG TPA: hypothetical protein [Caudoviricetes sp.]